MSTLGLMQLLFAALALVMAGQGLSMRWDDFRRLWVERHAVLLAAVLQLVFLPLVALALATVLSLPSAFAVGLMLLAAAPGSLTSSVYSHVFGGDVVLSATLTGVNTLVSIVTLPFITGWAMLHFAAGPEVAPSIVGKVLEVMVILVVPVGLGMAVGSRAPAFAARAERPMRVFSLLVLATLCVVAVVKERQALVNGIDEVGFSVVLFNLVALAVGYLVPRALKMHEPAAVSIAYHLGVRSSVLAMFVAMTALQNTQMALPAAVYSVTMILFAIAFGIGVRGASRRRVSPGAQARPPS